MIVFSFEDYHGMLKNKCRVSGLIERPWQMNSPRVLTLSFLWNDSVKIQTVQSFYALFCIQQTRIHAYPHLSEPQHHWKCSLMKGLTRKVNIDKFWTDLKSLWCADVVYGKFVNSCIAVLYSNVMGSRGLWSSDIPLPSIRPPLVFSDLINSCSAQACPKLAAAADNVKTL